MPDIDTEVAVLKDWRIQVVDPTLKGHGERLMAIEENQSEWKGSLKVIVWMNGIILSLVILLIATLFGWGLSHITLRVENASPKVSMAQPQQDAGSSIPVHY